MLALLVAACEPPPVPPEQPMSPVPSLPQPPPVATRPTPRVGAPVRLRVGAFSAAREVFGSKILPAFARQWQRQHGRPLVFETLFAGSEALTAAIGREFAADVAVVAHTHDVDQLERRGLVAPGWRERPHGGIVCRSLVVLAVRAGNPKRIRDWADLARSDVAVVSADPSTSGGGVWNVCAIYGAALRGRAGVPPGDHAAAARFLTRVLANMVGSHASSNDAYAAFRAGAGDVAVTYESEVALGWLFGNDAELLVPCSTVVVESAAAVVVARGADDSARSAAEALCQHLWSAEAQRQFAFCGLRPVDPDVLAGARARFPDPPDSWTIDFLGGWERAAQTVLGAIGRTPTTAAPPGR